jgi:hypothetical protein
MATLEQELEDMEVEAQARERDTPVSALAAAVGGGGDSVITDKLKACLDALDLLPAEIERLKVLASESRDEIERDAYLWKADAVEFQVERAARIAQERLDRLAEIKTEEDKEAEKQKCKEDTLYWFKFYAWGYDPRCSILPVQPYVPYPHQEPFMHWLNRTVLERRASGIVEKSRDEGATVGFLSWTTHKWLFLSGFSALLLSYSEDIIDSNKNPNTLFEKVRFQLRLTPSWMLPKGFNLLRDLNYMNIANPENGSTILGSAPTERAGRGGRATVVLADEFQAWNNGGFKQNVSLSQTAFSIIKLGTPYGTFNQYYVDTHTPNANVLVLDWRDNPIKDERWYKALPFGYVGTPMTSEAIAQEVDRDYDASQPGKVIKNCKEEYCFITWDELVAGFAVHKKGHLFFNSEGKHKIPDEWNWGRVTDYGESARQEDDTHIWAYSLLARPQEAWPFHDSLFFFYSLPIEPIGGTELEGFAFYSQLERDLGVRGVKGFIRQPELNDMSHEAKDPKEVLLEKCGDNWRIPDLDFDKGRRKLIYHFALTDTHLQNPFRSQLMGRSRIYFVAPPGEYQLAKNDRIGNYFVTPSQTQRGFKRLRREITTWHYPPEERGKPVPKMRPKPVFDDIITTVRYALARWGVTAASLTLEQKIASLTPSHARYETLLNQSPYEHGLTAAQEMTYIFHRDRARKEASRDGIQEFDLITGEMIEE